MGNIWKKGFVLSNEDIIKQEHDNANTSITNLSFCYYYYVAFKQNQKETAIKNIGHFRVKFCIYIYGDSKNAYGYFKTY